MSKKMNPEWKEKWLTALRSGEYKQGTRGLKRADNSFCCLGVLCDLVVKEQPDFTVERLVNEVTSFPKLADDMVNLGYPPPEVIALTGLPNHNPEIPSQFSARLAELNDRGMLFAGIADLIEAEL